jgi:hypothetical protein
MLILKVVGSQIIDDMALCQLQRLFNFLQNMNWKEQSNGTGIAGKYKYRLSVVSVYSILYE